MFKECVTFVKSERVTQLCPILCNAMDSWSPHGAQQAPLSMEFSRQEYCSV